MNVQIKQALRQMGPNLILFSLAVAALGLTSGIHETSFNNYLYDTFEIGASARGILEFPRELPGLLAAVLAGALIAFGLVRAAIWSMVFLAAGLFGLGFLSVSFPVMVVWMVIWSIGNHVFMPLEGSIAVSLAGERKVGQVLGQLGSIRLAATLVGAAVIWVGMGNFLVDNLTYQHTYLIAALVAAVGVIILLRIPNVRPSEKRQNRIVWKKQYWVFYVLCLLWGVRKQIFITFALWQLVQTFGQPASVIAGLWIITSLIGVFFRPYLGKLSDTFGERAILLAEVPITMLIFTGYALAPSLGVDGVGLYFMYSCYVLDSVMTATPLVRTSYVSKILNNKNDLAPTLAMGVSLDHITAMIMPAIGGFVWAMFGAHFLFLGAAAFLLLHAWTAWRATIPKTPQSQEAAA